MSRHRQRVIALTLIGILMAAGLVGGGWWLGQRGEEQPAASGVTTLPPTTTTRPLQTTSSPTPTTGAPVGTWTPLPAAPIPKGLYEYAGVWTGSELLIYGAVHDQAAGLRAAGAAYDPTTNTWRRLPPGPGPTQAAEGGYTAAWTGTEMLGWGLGMYGAYSPATNRWRRLAGPGFAGSVWTGRQVLTWGGGCCGENSDQGAAYTPATDSWQRMPQGPLAGRHTTEAWTGKELVIVGGNTTEGQIFADAAAYNPVTRTWRRLPRLPEPRANATATWTGTEVLVVGGYGPAGRLYADGLAYNPATNRWRRLPAMETSRVGHTAVWTGSRLLVWGGRILHDGDVTTPPRGLVYDPATDRWSAMPISPLRGRTGHVAVWTGSQMLIWGGELVRTNGQVNDGAAYMP